MSHMALDIKVITVSENILSCLVIAIGDHTLRDLILLFSGPFEALTLTLLE